MANLVDAPRTHLDKTVRVFDQFYNFDLVVPADQYDIIFSYFSSVCESSYAAKNLTTILFRISSITNENALVLFEEFYGKTALEATALMLYYLNSTKSKTTLYGVGVQPTPNEPVNRNVVM